VFSDIAIGEGGTASEGDWHAVQVLDHVTRQQVARYRSRIPVHDLPLVLFMIARYFNGAWLAPEINGPGQGVIDALNSDFGYSPIYRRHRSGDDQRNDAKSYLLGWQTTQPSKYLMEQTFGRRCARAGMACGMCRRPGSSRRTSEDPKRPTSHGAQPGAHDDLAISFMGAHRVAAELRPRDASKKKRDRWSPRDDTSY
jgi:hypothetical protein